MNLRGLILDIDVFYLEGVSHMQFSFFFKGYFNGYANMMPTYFSEFTPYSLSIQYCQVENMFSRNILLVPLSVCKGKKSLPSFPAFALNLTLPFFSTI